MQAVEYLPLLLLAAVGCGESGPSRVTFDVEVAGGATKDLANDHGYRVTVASASLHVSAVHFFSGDPLFTRRDEGLPRRLARLFVSVAHAHPGHYQEGDAMAEVLQAGTIDLIGPARLLGRAAGVTGAYRSAQVTLAETTMGGKKYLAYVEGKAAKMDQEVAFSGSLSGTIKVSGISAGATVDEQVKTVRMTVDLGRWLERIDFSKLAPCSPGSTCTPQLMKPGSQAHNAFSRGVNNTSAFTFSWKTQ